MTRDPVYAPARLLLDTALPASAKLVWLIGRHRGDWSPAVLDRYSGLARATVLKGLAALSTSQPNRGERGVPMPGALLTDQRLKPTARLLYGTLQLTGRQFTYKQLAELAGMSPNTVKQSIGELVKAGWLNISQSHLHAPIQFTLAHPFTARAQAEVELARQRLEEAPFYGEALMREFLDLLVDSDAFEDNAEPGFLVNPWTGERMQLDRFYPPDVAFEFNGPQHYGPTWRHSQESAAKQRGRDYMKMGICSERGIRLVVVQPPDLTLKGMADKLPDPLPRRDPIGHETLIKFLESAGRRYRRAAKAW